MTNARLLRLAVLATALSLAACGGSADPTGPTGAVAADPGPTGEGPVTAGMCAADQPDCTDTVTSGICAPSSTEGCDDVDAVPVDPAAGSCLAGDEGCTDESWGGQDVARPVPLADAPSGADPATRGPTSGATAHRIEHAHLLDEDTLELTVGDNPCMLVEDVLVEESADEVRVLVLAGQDASVDGCIEPYVQFAIEVDLAAPLGDRTLLDLAG